MKDYTRYTSKDGATLTMSQWGGSPAELELYRKLAELEDKIENGTLVELPCKVGDKVYVIIEDWDENYSTFYYLDEERFQFWHLDYLGKWVFLTKAEAEAKLRELKGEQQ